MFSEVELERSVPVLTAHLDVTGRISKETIITSLLMYLKAEKASKDDGYFLSVTRLKSIGKPFPCQNTGTPFFPVSVICRTFRPTRGETLEGVVDRVFPLGVHLRCGPVKCIYLSSRKMPKYQYVSVDNDHKRPFFISDDLSRIEKGVVVRFSVLNVRWVEKRDTVVREFEMLASIQGDSLGPVTTCGTEELDF